MHGRRRRRKKNQPSSHRKCAIISDGRGPKKFGFCVDSSCSAGSHTVRVYSERRADCRERERDVCSWTAGRNRAPPRLDNNTTCTVWRISEGGERRCMELCVSPSPGSNPCRTALLLQLGGAACTQCTECGLLLHCTAWPRVSVCWTQSRSDRPKCRLFAVWTQKGPRSRALGVARIPPPNGKGNFGKYLSAHCKICRTIRHAVDILNLTVVA